MGEVVVAEASAVAASPRRGRTRVRFSSKLGRAICARVAAGETISQVCRDEGMPNRGTVTSWAKAWRGFGKALSRAQTLGGWEPGRGGRRSGYCEVTAMEVFARVSEGESMASICADPAMPSASTVTLWRKRFPAFAGALDLARQVQAERFCEMGWEIASAVTPQDAYATHVKLTQLRWTAGVLAPARYGRFKAVAAETQGLAADREPQEVIFYARHFETVTGPDGKQYVQEIPLLPGTEDD